VNGDESNYPLKFSGIRDFLNMPDREGADQAVPQELKVPRDWIWLLDLSWIERCSMSDLSASNEQLELRYKTLFDAG
jgi:hypothetical protein